MAKLTLDEAMEIQGLIEKIMNEMGVEFCMKPKVSTEGKITWERVRERLIPNQIIE